MEYADIMNNLKKRVFHPVYFLCGEEPYYMDLISGTIEQTVLTEEERGFNQMVFYGKDTDITTVMEAARRFPMMASRQVIIVREAQSWKKLDQLAKYLKAPSPSTLLVINYKYAKPDLRTSEGKIIQSNTIYLETKKLREYQVPGWIENHVSGKGYSITPQASQMLTDFVGADLSRLAGELNKLFLVIPAGRKITPDEVEKNIGISKEYNTYELTDALGEKNVLKANRIVNYMAANPNACSFTSLTGNLFTYYSKLFRYHFLPDKSEKALSSALGIHSFFVRKYAEAANRYHRTRLFEIIGMIREYDLKGKGLNAAPGMSEADLLKELVYKILH